MSLGERVKALEVVDAHQREDIAEALKIARSALEQAQQNGRRLDSMDAGLQRFAGLFERHCVEVSELVDLFSFSKKLRKALLGLAGGVLLLASLVAALEPLARGWRAFVAWLGRIFH